MPKRTDISSILIIGAGPIVIGQACEFDYSGAQACKALKDEGYRVILVNSNPATIMTDPELADATYIEPITAEYVRTIIEKEKPDALLPTMGGQTALNTAVELSKNGTLDEFNVQLIGANLDAIEKAEDRARFAAAMNDIGLETPRSATVETWEEAEKVRDDIGLPAIIRPSFTLGGKGGGIAYNHEEFEHIVRNGLKLSPVSQVLIEESVLGWKEFEMEVVRDKADNAIIICSIENIDPMGIHTGDSLTVAPAMTLTDKEYQEMRNASIAVLREIGVETGGSNVQFAINPKDGRMVVIEMNPRVSRSSALASKATGFPIAKVAAKLAVGYTLDEIPNDITKVTPASFEPTIDYVVTKLPRFTFEKFPQTKASLTTSMRSVGEVMAMGRNFAESLQKALCSIEIGLDGLDEVTIPVQPPADDKQAMSAALSAPEPNRILTIAQAFRDGWSVDDIYRLTKYDTWFLRQIEALVQAEKAVQTKPELLNDGATMLHLKQQGFSDRKLAQLSGQTPQDVRAQRQKAGIEAIYKRVDSCAAEMASSTAYMYSSYEQQQADLPSCEADISSRKKVAILGGGPNRIGQGIEFDYCCTHAAFALKEMGIEAIMVNCNPETVSTDYDTADRLYFEPLTVEHTLNVLKKEQESGELLGVIVQFGGQTPLKLAHGLEEAGIPILGTAVDAIDLAEDRERFQQLVQKLNLKQPANGTATSLDEAVNIANTIGYPLVIRPSYVLGGRAMEIVYDESGLRRYMTTAVQVSGDSPVLLDSFLHAAVELDVDAIADKDGNVFIAGIMQHIEEAGIHSGDSSCTLPPYNLPEDTITELERQTKELAKSLGVQGLMNVQYAVKGTDVFLIEVNPRASRTVPFVAKATGVPIAKIATKVMAGQTLTEAGAPEKLTTIGNKIAVKTPVFPFDRFLEHEILLGPEMRSTGEVMGLGDTFGGAFLRAQLGAGHNLPESGTVFVTVRDDDKPAIVPLANKLLNMGYRVVSTRGTATYLNEQGCGVGTINKVYEGQPHIVDAMISKQISMVINTTDTGQAIWDSAVIRQSAVSNSIPCFTTLPAIEAALAALEKRHSEAPSVTCLQNAS